MTSTPIERTLSLPMELSQGYLENYQILPFRYEGNFVQVATCGPPDDQVLDDLRLLFQSELQLVDVDEATLQDAIQEAVDAAARNDPTELATIAPDTDNGQTVAEIRDLASQPPVVRFVNLLIRDALDARASDIHLSWSAATLAVRYRVDGVVCDAAVAQGGLAPAAIVSRVKLLANLDIAERRIPQDGRITVRFPDRELDVRVSTVPATEGESVVLRLLDIAGQPEVLDALGMSAPMLETFSTLVRQPHGIVLVTGPTGSGKTTTLHAAVRLRDLSRERVITVEDPVEYVIDGATQIAVNEKAGLTFAAALRSVLRQDPDVLLVGEIRDCETADVGIRAAMTGHLVLATLHTNDAASAVPRLKDLGVDAYLIESTIEAVLAQRLVRRTCTDCATQYRPDGDLVARLKAGPVGSVRLMRGGGCDRCRGTGFFGRVGLFELFTRADLSATEDRHPPSLRNDAWLKVQAGLTTVEEVFRVLNL